MDRDPPNPYVEMSLRDLSTAMGERASDLLENRKVSRRDIAYLLIASAGKIDPMTAHPNSPVPLVKRGSKAEAAFMPVYEAEAKRMRYRIFVHADDTLCAVHGVERLVPHNRWDSLAALATADEAGLRAAIEQLDQVAGALKI